MRACTERRFRTIPATRNAPNRKPRVVINASSQFHWKGDGKGTKLSVPGREYTRFTLPNDVKPGETIHIVAEATDNGVPALTRYERFAVAIDP